MSSKSIALLAYLRLTSGQRAHRAFLADLLWSEVDEERGRASLRQAALTVRALCGEALLLSDGKELRLGAELSCDAVDFAALAGRGENADAAKAYAGDFFGQFALPGARGFELWATVERERLRGIHARAADAATQKLLDEGRARSAADIAAALVSVDPLRERSWRLLLECRLMQGDLATAGVDAEAMQAHLAAHDVALEPATVSLLRRIQSRNQRVPQTDDLTLRADLVGRVAAFAALVDVWKAVEARGGAARSVTGPAGIGKTRLLEDFAVRLRSLGARVIHVRALLGEQDIPFALTAQLAGAVAVLPGAAGIAEESAATLVGLEPRLRTVFQGQQPDVSYVNDIALRRATALVDLLGAVSDERALALIVDDLHWADSASVSTLAAVCARLAGVRVLIIVAQRHQVSAALGAADIPLSTLDADEIAELLQSLAVLPDEGWALLLPRELHRVSGGTPLLVMEALRLLTSELLLIRGSSSWEHADVAALLTRLATLDVRQQRLSQLDGAMRRILVHLSLAGCALQDKIISVSVADPSYGMSVSRLLSGGWIVITEGRVVVSHDEVASSVLGICESAESQAASRGLLRALRSATEKSDAEWRLEARLLLESADWDGLVRVLDERMMAIGGRDRRWPDALANLLGDLGTRDVMREVRKRRPLFERVNRQSRILAAALLLVSAIAGVAWYRAVTPYELRFVSAPLVASDRGVAPLPVIEIVNRNGTRLQNADIPVELRLNSPTARIAAEQVQEVHDGLRSFSGSRVLGLDRDTARIVIEAASPGLVSARTVLLRHSDSYLRLEHLTAASGNVSVRGDTMFVDAGARVAVNAQLLYSAAYYAASVMIAGVPTWGDPATSWLELGPMATPAKDMKAFVPISFDSPRIAGRFRLFIVMAAESDAAHIAAATNWAVGAPRWNDGDDLAHWGDAEAASARQLGQVKSGTWLFQQGRAPVVSVPATVIDVVVRDAAVRTAAASRE